MAHLSILVHGDSWLDFLQVLLHLPDKHKGVVALCCAQVFCYHIWRERNSRMHDKGVFGPSKLLLGICMDVKARLHSSAWFSKIVCNRPDLVII